ncbi:MAG TPA: thiamine biosynthesis protein [Candidatus Polarisedimenticolia bacterium]|jgi:tRNA U34 2-thiouridine synthase MnmA/TrmU|nr:thiamine biosynthesis protein [Candidatus Polarisedimenticolia bacterium]
MERSEPIRALGLISGGLDSTLAARVLMEQGIEVLGLNFSTGFCSNDQRRAVGRPGEALHRLRNEALRAGSDLGVEVEIVPVEKEYFGIVTHPKHGHGAHMNPCIDCRIFMLRKARARMDELKAHFIFTGEVLGQRPMSQHLTALQTIEREAHLEGLLLRPLSAHHLPETLPEKRGWVDRARLLAIAGRSRRGQLALAETFQISEFPQPSGGCCSLTDDTFSRRLRDVLDHQVPFEPGTEDAVLLKVGRHFRVSHSVKVVVGRDEAENKFLRRHLSGRWWFEVPDGGSPLVMAQGEPGPDLRRVIAGIVARYSSKRSHAEVEVLATREVQVEHILAKPSTDPEIEAFRI